MGTVRIPLLTRTHARTRAVGTVTAELVVSLQPSPHRRARFFQHGRQINFVADVKSFMDVSKSKVGAVARTGGAVVVAVM